MTEHEQIMPKLRQAHECGALPCGATLPLAASGTTAPQPIDALVFGERASRPAPHLLHVFASFGIGGVPLRMARILNHFGQRLRHTIVALDQDFAAARDLAADLNVGVLATSRRRDGTIRSLRAAITELRRLRPDLLITYNWGAIEWAMANRLWPVARQLHFEAGFGKEEADGQIRRRVLFRRWALARAGAVVVPSRRLEELARRVWKLPPGQVIYIPNGVDILRFANPPRDAVAGFCRRPGELVVGTVAPLRPEKNLARLLHAFAGIAGPPAARLIIAGDGGERPALARLAAELGIAERVIFLGQVAAEMVLGTFDVFALSSDTEQMPNALLEAMAAGCAVAAVDVGDVKDMVSPLNQEFVVARDDGRGFSAALSRLLGDPAKRAELGLANRRRAVESFAQERMFTAYSHLFGLDQGA